MYSILNMLKNFGEDGLNTVIMLPLLAVFAAVALLLKFSLRKPEVTKKSEVRLNRKQQISQAVNDNKQQKEKIGSEKKQKVAKDKKPSSSSPAKPSSSEASKTKPNKKQSQQSLVDEKSSKKSSAIAKQQQVNNNNVKSNASSNKNNKNTNKKQQAVDIFIDKEEGEWQMVTTKKQKQNKQDENVEIVTTTDSKKSQKSPEKANKQASSVNKKSEENKERSKNSTKVLTTETITTVGEIKDVYTDPVESIHKSVESTFLAEPETKIDTRKNISANNSEINANQVVQDATPIVANVAFDELGDDGWTDTKPQKKNRKKALRE